MIRPESHGKEPPTGKRRKLLRLTLGLRDPLLRFWLSVPREAPRKGANPKRANANVSSIRSCSEDANRNGSNIMQGPFGP